MNKDKAIQLLERLQDPEPYEPMLTKDAYDAIQMAIDALSADGDTISRKAAIDALNKLSESTYEVDYGVVDCDDAIGAIEQLPPAQLGTNLAEVGTDCISRQSAIKALKDATFDFEACKIVLEQLPPIQPEIIRCKDCRNNHWCNIQEAAMAGDNFFCGAAERRTDE